MNYCPKCGFPTENMKFCPKCGFELKESESNISEDMNNENVTPEVKSSVVESASSANRNESKEYSRDDEIRDLRAALVGEKADHYVPIFEGLDKNGGQSWNWCGCLFAPMWFAYRKLYGWSAIAIFAPTVVGFLIGIVLVATSAGDGVTNVLSRCLGIAFAIAFGVISNSAYKKRIDRLIVEMPEGEEARKRYIDRKGGVSGGGLVLALIIYLGVAMLMTLIGHL